MDLTEEQWCVLEPLLPEREQSDASPAKGGRPFRPARDVLNGVLWVLRTGAPWADMPGRYPPYQTCHRRFQRWVENGTLKRILRTLAQDLRDRGKLDLTEAYIDGTHAGAKKGVLMLDETDAARRPRSWQWRTATVFLSPWGLRVVSGQGRELPRLPPSRLPGHLSSKTLTPRRRSENDRGGPQRAAES